MAIVFAIALGWCGVHRFTLGQWQWGLFHIFLFIVSMSVADSIDLNITPWMTLSALVAYGHGLKWWRMTDEEFGEQFLEPVDADDDKPITGKYLKGQEVVHPRVLSGRARRGLLASAKTAYDAFDYQLAAERYEQALDLDLQDGESRVQAARCYTLLEDGEAAYRHLAKAVQLRATNLDLISSDDDFAWLRTQSDFELRRRTGFGIYAEPVEPPPLRKPHPEPTGRPSLPAPRANLLDDLERLASLRERGVLDDEEFVRQKERLLRS